MSFLTKVKVTASDSIKDTRSALNCVEYILEHEAKDYFDQADNLTQENWETEWDKVSHVYVDALKAVGKTPEASEFYFSTEED